MVDRDEVCVLIPTYNEAAAVGGVVERFLDVGYGNVLVVDGGSTDGTRQVATDAGAEVVEQSGEGKGQAVREAVGLIDRPYVLLIDGDATYRPEQADRLVEPLQTGEAEHTIGDRFADMEPGAMTRLNRAGNRMINRAFSFVHGRNLQDILSGYRGFTRESFERLSLTADGFGIETEMAVECVRHDVETAVVPVTYEARPDGSETNLRPFRDGGHILLTLYRLAKKNNPIFYFGSVGVASGVVGVVLAIWVAARYLLYGISHEVIALASGVALLFGLQLLMFGILSDLIVTANRNQRQQFERIERRLDELEADGSKPVADDAAPDDGAVPEGADGAAVAESRADDHERGVPPGEQ